MCPDDDISVVYPMRSRVGSWLLYACFVLPAIWLLLHVSFVFRADAAGLWPPGGAGNGFGTWDREFPHHFAALRKTFKIVSLLPLPALLVLATNRSRARWPLVVASLWPQVEFYSSLNTPAELLMFWGFATGCACWAWWTRRQASTRLGLWLAVQCALCSWLVLEALHSYDVIAE